MKKLFGILLLLVAFTFFIGAGMFYKACEFHPVVKYVSSGIFSLLGLFFVGIGIKRFKTWYDGSVSYKEGLLLKQNALPVKAKIIDLVHANNIRVNGRSPFVISAEYGGTVYKTQWIWRDVIYQIQTHKTIDLYIDSSNPKKYFIDLESIGLDNTITKNTMAKVGLVFGMAGLLIPISLALALFLNRGEISKIQQFQSTNVVTSKLQDSTVYYNLVKQFNSDPSQKLLLGCMEKVYGQDVLSKMATGTLNSDEQTQKEVSDCFKQAIIKQNQ